MACSVGARGPHGEIAPTSWAFELHTNSLPSGKQTSAVGAADVVVIICGLHSLLKGCAPRRKHLPCAVSQRHRQAETLHEAVILMWGRGAAHPAPRRWGR